MIDKKAEHFLLFKSGLQHEEIIPSKGIKSVQKHIIINHEKSVGSSLQYLSSIFYI